MPAALNLKKTLSLLIATGVMVSSIAQAQDVVPRTVGPVSVSELRMLLGRGIYFQIFDFDADDDFCVYFRVKHEVNGSLKSDEPVGGECWTKGPSSLLFRSEYIEGQHRFHFGVQNRETGGGGSFSPRPYLIGHAGGQGLGYSQPSVDVLGDQELLTLSLTEFDPETRKKSTKHRIQVSVRFESNPTKVMGSAPGLIP